MPRNLIEELRALLKGLPNKWLFVALALSWLLLFALYGNNTFGYHSTRSLFTWLYVVYTHSEDDAYGFMIPVAVVALLIWKRRELLAVEKVTWLPGLLVLLMGNLLHLVGYLVQQNRLSVLGFVVGLFGLTGLAWGRAWLASTFFPMFLLIFLIPVGALQDTLTLPLRLFVTKASVGVGNLFLGLGYESHGSKIFTDFGVPVFDVAPACSGIRSLISLFVLSTIYAFMRFDRNWKRAAIVAAAIPLAVLGNFTRIFIVLIIGRAVSFEAGAYIEQKLGILTFLIAFGGLFVLGKLVKEKPDDEQSGSDLCMKA